MRKFHLSLLCLLFTSMIFAQNSFIEKNFSNQLEKSTTTRVQVGTKAFSMLTTFAQYSNDEDAQKVAKIASKVKSFDLIVVPGAADVKTNFDLGIKKSAYMEELIKIKSKEALVSLRIDESNDVIRELVGIIAADSNFIVFDLVGEFRLDDITELTKTVNESKIKSMLGNKGIDFGDAKVYPNPVQLGQNVSIDVPTSMTNATVTVYSLDGKKLKEEISVNGNYQMSTSGLGKGNYTIKVEGNGVSVNKRLIVIE